MNNKFYFQLSQNALNDKLASRPCGLNTHLIREARPVGKRRHFPAPAYLDSPRAPHTPNPLSTDFCLNLALRFYTGVHAGDSCSRACACCPSMLMM